MSKPKQPPIEHLPLATQIEAINKQISDMLTVFNVSEYELLQASIERESKTLGLTEDQMFLVALKVQNRICNRCGSPVTEHDGVMQLSTKPFMNVEIVHGPDSRYGDCSRNFAEYHWFLDRPLVPHSDSLPEIGSDGNRYKWIAVNDPRTRH